MVARFSTVRSAAGAARTAVTESAMRVEESFMLKALSVKYSERGLKCKFRVSRCVCLFFFCMLSGLYSLTINHFHRHYDAICSALLS